MKPKEYKFFEFKMHEEDSVIGKGSNPNIFTNMNWEIVQLPNRMTSITKDNIWCNQ